jgi:hypothetical protein
MPRFAQGRTTLPSTARDKRWQGRRLAKRTAASRSGCAKGSAAPQPTIILSRGDEPEPGKPRLHVDVNATERDQGADLDRLLKYGARPADIGQSGEEPRHLLADPEGNEFCLLKGPPQPALTALCRRRHSQGSRTEPL